MSITPTDCIQCRLCEPSCPFGAIIEPSEEKPKESKQQGAKRLMILTALLPVLIIVGAYLGSLLYVPLSKVNNKVSLSEQLIIEEKTSSTAENIDTDTFKELGQPREELFQESRSIMKSFEKGGWYFGGFIGLMIGLTLIGLAIRKKQTDYVPDKGNCLSCGRCFDFCPMDPKSRVAHLKDELMIESTTDLEQKVNE